MPSRRQFLTASALSLVGILSGRETKANGFKKIQEGTCISPIFKTQGRYQIGRNQQEESIPKVEILWYDNRNWTNDAYTETVDREQVLKTVEENRKLFEIAENIASNLGFPNPFNELMQKIQERLGIKDPKEFTLDALLTDLSPELSQELADVQRWDVYKHTAGTIAGNRTVTTTNYISFRPSNIPEVRNINVEVQGGTAVISWQGYDKTTYPELNLPWYKFRFPQLPLDNIDLTIFLNEPYDGTVPTYYLLLIDPDTNTAIRNESLVAKTRYLDASEKREFSGTTISIPNLAMRNHKLRIQAFDDANNESQLVYSELFAPQNYQPTQSQTLTERIQEHYTYSDDNEGSNFGSTWKAQTFTTPNTISELKYIKLKLFREGDPGPFSVGIQRVGDYGQPIGQDLSYGIINGNVLSTQQPGEWVKIYMPSYILQPSTKYAIVARAHQGDTSNKVYTRFNSSGTYPGGNRWYSTNAGNSWKSDPGSDLMFEIHIK